GEEAIVLHDSFQRFGSNVVAPLIDKEFARILGRLETVGSGVHVTVVLDSCFSGGATRGSGAGVRSIGRAEDVLGRPYTPDVSLPDDPMFTNYNFDGKLLRGQTSTRSAQAGSIVVLTAAGEREEAREVKIGGANGTSSGLFTTALLAALSQGSPSNLTYADV